MVLSEEQLNNLNKEALVIIVASLQDQLSSMQSQLDNTANRQIADTNRQIELLTEQIRIMNQRKFGRQSESNLIEGQLTLFDSFNEVELTASESAPEPEISQIVIASYRRLHIIPETFIVDEHHVHVYASKDNDGTIVEAPRGTDLFRNSIATPSLVASSTIGRKNFVLIESSNGAHASAIIYSLVETAKANYRNVYQYFELLLTEIPKHMNDTDLKFIEELLPWAPHVQETCPSRFKKS